jgi:hypothetical protein
LNKLPRTILTLEKRLATLRGLLNKSASEQKLLKAAVRVRDARIQVLRATIGSMPSVIRTPAQNRRVARLNDEVEALREVPPLAILDQFRTALPKASGES